MVVVGMRGVDVSNLAVIGSGLLTLRTISDVEIIGTVVFGASLVMFGINAVVVSCFGDEVIVTVVGE